MVNVRARAGPRLNVPREGSRLPDDTLLDASLAVAHAY